MFLIFFIETYSVNQNVHIFPIISNWDSIIIILVKTKKSDSFSAQTEYRKSDLYIKLKIVYLYVELALISVPVV